MGFYFENFLGNETMTHSMIRSILKSLRDFSPEDMLQCSTSYIPVVGAIHDCCAALCLCCGTDHIAVTPQEPLLLPHETDVKRVPLGLEARVRLLQRRPRVLFYSILIFDCIFSHLGSAMRQCGACISSAFSTFQNRGGDTRWTRPTWTRHGESETPKELRRILGKPRR